MAFSTSTDRGTSARQASSGLAEAGLRPCTARFLGRVEFNDAWKLQQQLAEQRSHGNIADTFLLLEHPPVYTLGRTADRNNLLIPEADLSRIGATLVEIDRGGDITYHGPGQLVGYPIMLWEDRRDLVAFIRRLEEVLIRTLSDIGVNSGRTDGLSGVWVGQEKIAAIGVKIGRVTTHGFALNLTTDMSYFNHIIPCGIVDKGVTSVARVLDSPHPFEFWTETIVPILVRHFGVVFERQMIWDGAEGMAKPA